MSHLASHVLVQLARRVGADRLQHWGFEPLLLEAFVDPRHYAGTCYRAAGWELLGQTSGRGLARPGQTDRSTPRQVWVEPLSVDWPARLCAVSGSLRPRANPAAHAARALPMPTNKSRPRCCSTPSTPTGR